MTTPPPDADLLLFPRLTRYYGLSYEELMRMPRAAVRIYLDAYRELVAEDQLLAIQAATFPYVDEDTRRDIMRSLMRRAAPTNMAQRVDPTAEEGIDALANIGIRVRRK